MSGGRLWGVVALAVSPFILLLVHQWGWHPDALSGDYAQYVLHAQALLDGRGYADIGYLHHPAAWDIGPPAYPPGFPLTLVPVIAVAGAGLGVFRIVSVIAAILSVAAFSIALPREIPRWQGVLAGALTLFAMEASGGLLAPLSDPGFCALWWVSAWAMSDGRQSSWRRALCLTLVGALAVAFRIVGVLLIPALLIQAALTRREDRVRALVPVAVWGLAGIVALAIGRVSLPYREMVGAITDIDGSRLGDIASAARFSLFDVLTYPFPWDLANDVYHLLGAAITAWGLLAIVRRWYRHPVVTWSGLYALMLLVVPVSDTRYYWPLFPMLALGFIMGLNALLATRRGAPAARLTVAAVLSLLLGATASRWSHPAPASLAGSRDGEQLFAWVRATATPAMRVAFRNPRVLTLHTRVPAMGLGDRTALGQLAMFDDRAITHVVVTVAGRLECKDLILRELVARAGDRLVRVWANTTYQAYALRPGPPVDASTWEPIDWQQRARFCPQRAGSD